MSYQKILTLLAMIGVVCQLTAKSINTYDIKISPGETRDFFIYMNTTRTNLVSFQIDLKLSEGLTINVDSCKLPTRILDKDQILHVGKLDDNNNIYRLVSTSYNLTPFTTADAPLVQVSITASEDFKGGTVSLQDMFTVNSDAGSVAWIAGEFNVEAVPFMKGDTDYNGMLSVNDCAVIVYYILEEDRLFTSRYDVNEDNVVDLTDLQDLIKLILNKTD